MIDLRIPYRRWIGAAQGSTLASSLAALLSLSAHALILRELPRADAVTYALVIATAQTIALGANLGQPVLTMRITAEGRWAPLIGNEIFFLPVF